MKLPALFFLTPALLLSALANPIAHFPFDGDTLDASGNGNHGTFIGGAATYTADRHGNPTGALAFKDTDEFLEVFHNSGLPLTTHRNFTITGWIKGPSFQEDNRLFSEFSTNNSQPVYNFGTEQSNTTRQIELLVRDDSGTILVPRAQTTSPYFDNTWHRFTLIDRNGSVSIFLDGELQSTIPTASYHRGTLTLNKTILRAPRSQHFEGALDDVIFHDTDVLTVFNTNDDGPGSLRQSIADAPIGATILFDPDVFGGEQEDTILLDRREIRLTKRVNIDASAIPGGVTIDGGGRSRVLGNYNTSSPTILNSLTITGGKTHRGNGGDWYGSFGDHGGGIKNQGSLTILNSTITGNTTGDGGYGEESGGGAGRAVVS